MRTSLFETAAAEQHRMRNLFQAMIRHNLFKAPQHAVTFAAMDHAKQVIAPLRQAPRPLVTQGHTGLVRQQSADALDLGIREMCIALDVTFKPIEDLISMTL